MREKTWIAKLDGGGGRQGGERARGDTTTNSSGADTGE